MVIMTVMRTITAIVHWHIRKYGRTKMAKERVLQRMATVRFIRRSVGAVHDKRSLWQDPMSQTDAGTHGRCEMDTHADTCVAGANFLLIGWDGMTADVGAFHGSYEVLRDVPIVHCCTAWTNPEDGETVILDMYQCLWFGKQMNHSLLNPNQIRHFLGRCINDDPTDTERPFGLQLEKETVIPFALDGTIIHFNTRVPTQVELDDCRHVTLTADTNWDPATISLRSVQTLSREEEELRKVCATTNNSSTAQRHCLEPDYLSTISPAYDEETFCNRMISSKSNMSYLSPRVGLSPASSLIWRARRSCRVSFRPNTKPSHRTQSLKTLKYQSSAR